MNHGNGPQAVKYSVFSKMENKWDENYSSKYWEKHLGTERNKFQAEIKSPVIWGRAGCPELSKKLEFTWQMTRKLMILQRESARSAYNECKSENACEESLKGIGATMLGANPGWKIVPIPNSQYETPHILGAICYNTKKGHGSVVWKINPRLNTVLVSSHSTELKCMTECFKCSKYLVTY